jgi:hypothetical protein
MSRGLRLGLLTLILLLLTSLPLAMQFETGSIEGLIVNDRGPINHASVEARHVVSGAVFESQSDASGHYQVTNLRPGKYSLFVQAPGHDSTWIRQVIVEHGQTTHTDVHLSRSQTTISGVRSRGAFAALHGNAPNQIGQFDCQERVQWSSCPLRGARQSYSVRYPLPAPFHNL